MKKVKVEGQGQGTSLHRVTICRNGQIHALAREVCTVKTGSYRVGQHVMLAITGDCCYGRSVYAEYEVTNVQHTDAYGGREKVTFDRVEKRPVTK